MKIGQKFDELRAKNKAADFIFSLTDEIGRSKIGRNASSISFYAFISMIPLFILLCAQLPFTGISENELQDAIVNITPDAVHELVALVVTEAYTARKAIFSVSAVFLLWASSKAMLSVIQSLDMVYDVKERRPYISMIGFALLYTVAALVIVGGLLVVFARGHSIEDIISTAFPTKAMFEAWAKRGHNILSLIVLTAVFALIYRFAPSGKRKLVHQLPGALFAAVGTSVFSIFFAIYNNRGNIYKSFYGSLTVNAVFLIWVYFSISIILIGGVINKHYEEQIKSFFTKRKK
jgi:membrane protein